MVNYADLFVPTTSFVSNLNLVQKPIQALNQDDKDKRKKQFGKIVEDITGKISTDFQKENTVNYRQLRAINLAIIMLGMALLIASIVRGFTTGVDASIHSSVIGP